MLCYTHNISQITFGVTLQSMHMNPSGFLTIDTWRNIEWRDHRYTNGGTLYVGFVASDIDSVVGVRPG